MSRARPLLPIVYAMLLGQVSHASVLTILDATCASACAAHGRPWTEAQRAQLQKAVGPALDIEQLGRHPVARLLHGRVEKILLAALAEDTTMTTNPSTATRAGWHNGLSGVVAPLSALVAEARTLLEHQHAVHGARYGLILRSL